MLSRGQTQSDTFSGKGENRRAACGPFFTLKFTVNISIPLGIVYPYCSFPVLLTLYYVASA